MSEAIENMDGLKTNLDNLKESLEAAKQIEKVYDQYNQIVLYHKAAKYKKENAQYHKIDEQLKHLETTIKKTEEKYEQELHHHEKLSVEQSARQEERRSLEHNDATKLKEQEMCIRDRCIMVHTSIVDFINVVITGKKNREGSYLESRRKNTRVVFITFDNRFIWISTES